MATSPFSSCPSSACEKTVESTLTALVKHYSQPIHQQTSSSSLSSPLAEQRHTEISPVTQQLLNRLFAVTLNDDNEQTLDQRIDIIIIQQWICGYASHVRPILLPALVGQQTRRTLLSADGVAVLQHYHVILSCLVLEQTNAQDGSSLPSSLSSKGNLDNRGSRVASSISLMARDVSFLTEEPTRSAADENTSASSSEELVTAQGVVLPILLDIMALSIPFLDGNYDNQKVVATRTRRTCAVTLLAFSGNTTSRPCPNDLLYHWSNRSDGCSNVKNDTSIISSILTFQTASLLDDFAISTRATTTTTSWLDWTMVEMDASAWNDDGVTQAAVQSCWKALLLVLDNNDNDGADNDSKNVKSTAPTSRTSLRRTTLDDNTSDNDVDLDNIKKGVLQQLDWIEMAKVVRAHFYGRDDDSDETSTTTPVERQAARPKSWQYPLPQRPPEQPLHAPIQQRPSRLNVAMEFVRLFDCRQCQKLTLSSRRDLLREVLPMIYTLLDSLKIFNVAWGAAALLHLIHTLDEAQYTDGDANDGSGRNHEMEGAALSSPWDEFQESLLPILALAVKTTREGPAVFLVALATSRTFALALPHCHLERRQATQQFLAIASRHKYSENEALLVGLLVGGIVPLLQQSIAASSTAAASTAGPTQSQPSNASLIVADAMEVGRFGLSTLLAMLSSLSTWIQGASLVALGNLILAAYPIMPRHGGAITSQLLALLGNCVVSINDDNDEYNSQEIGTTSMVNMATTVAAVAWIVCGERAAAILNEVDDNCNVYDAALVKQVGSIRKEVIRLQRQAQNHDEVVKSSTGGAD